MSKLKPVIVTITKTKHKSQPYVFTIDVPGPQGKETKCERYASAKSAKRGALRKLGAWAGKVTAYRPVLVLGKPRDIVFVLK